jgi:flagellar hook-associated protein 2
MSSITSGIGLISGLPTSSLIDQLLLAERTPIINLQGRAGLLDQQRNAFNDIISRLGGLSDVAQRFGEVSIFRSANARSSNEDAIAALARDGAVPGSYSVTVASLANTHQLVSTGYADRDSVPIGAGNLTLESSRARLDAPTLIDELNGGEGIRRGRFTITDAAGNAAEIDIRSAISVDEVLDAVNGQSDAAVRARIVGDRLELVDSSGGSGTLKVIDQTGGHAASDLGIATTVEGVSGGVLTSHELIRLTDESRLQALNDGNGVRRARAGGDFLITSTTEGGYSFRVDLSGSLTQNTYLDQLNNGNGVRLGSIRISNRAGNSADIDLSQAESIGDIITSINGAGLELTASAVNGHLQVSDGSTPAEAEDEDGNPIEPFRFTIEDLDGGFAARDLGIVADTLGNLAIGSDVFRVTTLGDVVRAINYAQDESGVGINDGTVEARISADGKRIELISNEIASDGGNFVLTSLGESRAVVDLGLDVNIDESGDAIALGDSISGRRIIGGLNSTLLNTLNGGNGIDVASFQLTTRAGQTTTIDLSGDQRPETLNELIDIINSQAPEGVTVSVNSVGNGLAFTDTTDGEGQLSASDVSGTTIRDLFRLEVDGPGSIQSDEAFLNTGNTQRKYISEATELASLQNGRGVRRGSFVITDRTGGRRTVTINNNQNNLGDVIRVINGVGAGRIVAEINNQGDGIIIRDTTGGNEPLTITDQPGSFTARDLNIAGTAEEGEAEIDGSLESNISIDSDDTLDDLAQKINEAGGEFTASVLNVGSGTRPFVLSVTSDVTGRDGALLVDGANLGLNLRTLVEARDAVVFLGDGDVAEPLLITSQSNTLDGALPGVSLDLLDATGEPVSVTITENLDDAIDALNGFVSSYNGVINGIDDLTSFDEETEQRGLLLGDPSINSVRDRLSRLINSSFNSASSLGRLTNVGLTFDSGGQLSFDENRFREAYAEDPAGVEALFAGDTNGFAARFEEVIDGFVDSIDGSLVNRTDLLNSRRELIDRRVESLNELLGLKRARLQREFAVLEQSLAGFQGQQDALGVLAGLV